MIDWNLAINVTVTGILLVFAMLLLLVFVLYIFGLVSVSLSKSKEKKAAKARNAALLEMKESAAESPVAIQQVSETEDDEIVAVISAAVASIYQNSNVKPVIKSIKKASARRSSWATAGIADNTRAF